MIFFPDMHYHFFITFLISVCTHISLLILSLPMMQYIEFTDTTSEKNLICNGKSTLRGAFHVTIAGNAFLHLFCKSETFTWIFLAEAI